MGLSATARQRYRVDLSAEHAECERNYARLMPLLSSLSCPGSQRLDSRQLESQQLESQQLESQQLESQQADTVTVGLPGPGHTQYCARFTVIERSPYTTTVELHISLQPSAPALPASTLTFTLSQQLTIRLYHDASMAEVVGFQHRHKPAARYVYPNARMFQPDEKWQWNRFLGEWLAYCQHHGYSLAPLAFNPVSGVHDA